MNGNWKFAGIGAVAGAVLAVAAVFGAAALGVLPGTGDRHLHDYLTAHPELLAEMSDRLQAQQDEQDQRSRQAAVDKIGLAKFFDPRIAFVTGPANARRTMVEFFDYNCPYCRASLPAIRKYYEAHKNDTRFAFIEFPIKGPNSTMAARAAIAARRQPGKYLDFYFAMMGDANAIDPEGLYADARKAGLDTDKLMADVKDPTVDQSIAAAHALAKDAGIDGTPTFIIDGKVHPGAVDESDLDALTKG